MASLPFRSLSQRVNTGLYNHPIVDIDAVHISRWCPAKKCLFSGADIHWCDPATRQTYRLRKIDTMSRRKPAAQPERMRPWKGRNDQLVIRPLKSRTKYEFNMVAYISQIWTGRRYLCLAREVAVPNCIRIERPRPFCYTIATFVFHVTVGTKRSLGMAEQTWSRFLIPCLFWMVNSRRRKY